MQGLKNDMPILIFLLDHGLWLSVADTLIFYVSLEQVTHTSNAWNTYHVEIKSTNISR